MKLRALTIGAGALLAVGGVSAKDYTIKPKYEAGDRHLVTMDTSMNMLMMGQKMTMSIGMSMGQEVEAHEKGHEIKFGFERVNMDMNMMGQNIKYDSNAENKDDPMWKQLDKSLRPLLKAEMSVVLDNDGQAVQTKEAKMDPALKQMGIDANDFVNSFNQQLKMLPKKPVAVGEKWDSEMEIPIGKGNKVKTKVSVKLESVNVVEGNEIATLKFKGSFNADVVEGGIKMNMECDDYDGTSTFNITKGTFGESIVDMKMKMEMAQGADAPKGLPAMGGIEIEAKTKTTVKVRKKVLR